MKKQTYKVGQPGSFQCQIMSNNSSEPVVGEWYTQMFYSDRHVGKVVSIEGEVVTLEEYNTVAAKMNSQMGHQDWKHSPSGNTFQVKWFARWNQWRKIGTTIEFTKEFREKCGTEGVWKYLNQNNPVLEEEIYQNQVHPQKVIPGITREKAISSPVRLLFGVCDYRYDWEF